MEVNKVIHGTVEDEMRHLPCNSFDLVVADPPFNIGKNYDNYDDTRDDYFEWMRYWVSESFRVCKETGSVWIYCPVKLLRHYLNQVSRHGIVQNVIVWFYSNPPDEKRRFPRTWSPWIFATKTKDYKFFPEFEKTSSFQTRRHCKIYDVWYDIPKIVGGYLAQDEVLIKDYKRICVYQLPIILIQRIIGFCTEKDDLVLDLFSHSGTTSKAAQFMKRNYLAIEQSKKYCEIITKRLKRVSSFNL